VPPPSTFATGISPALDAVVRRALERSPRSRFPTALEFQVALEGAMPPGSAREVGVWVQSVGGATIAARRRELLAMLHAPSASGSDLSNLDALPLPPLEFIEPAPSRGTDDDDLGHIPGLPSGPSASRVMGFGVLCVLVLLVGGGAQYLQRSSSPRPASATAVDAGRPLDGGH